jgi:dihydrofolate reductase
MDGWFDPAATDDDMLAVVTEHRNAADALVLGRTTYEEFLGYWPAQTNDTTGITDYLNRIEKYVVSSALDHADWEHSTILRGPIEEEVAALKRRPGKDIVVTGSATLVRSLLPAGLVDVYRLFVHPVVQGYGERLFPEKMAAGLHLTGTTAFGSGVVLLEYRAPRAG